MQQEYRVDMVRGGFLGGEERDLRSRASWSTRVIGAMVHMRCRTEYYRSSGHKCLEDHDRNSLMGEGGFTAQGKPAASNCDGRNPDCCL